VSRWTPIFLEKLIVLILRESWCKTKINLPL
jgi:hypothetical protein